jgi:hypothetical protein
MKDTYWYVLVALGLVGVSAWVGTLLGRHGAEKLRIEGRLNEPKSVWTRDLFATRVGRVFVTFILSPLLVAEGVLAIINRHARWKSFDYSGSDAAFIGIGEIGMGLVMMALYAYPLARFGDTWFRRAAIWCGLACVFVGFSVALFRNI